MARIKVEKTVKAELTVWLLEETELNKAIAKNFAKVKL